MWTARLVTAALDLALRMRSVGMCWQRHKLYWTHCSGYKLYWIILQVLSTKYKVNNYQMFMAEHFLSDCLLLALEDMDNHCLNLSDCAAAYMINLKDDRLLYLLLLCNLSFGCTFLKTKPW